MTPLEIEILLHYLTRVVDYRDGDYLNAPAVIEALDNFVREDMLKPIDGKHGAKFRLLPRAVAFIGHICSLPLPVMKWEMPT